MITLEPLSEEHRSSLLSVLGDKAFDFTLSQADLDNRAVLSGEQCVGLVTLRLQPEQAIEVNVTIAHNHRRKGYAVAAVREMLRIAFEDHNLPHVHARCQPGSPSQGVIEKLPFHSGGPFLGQLIYRMTKAEWISTLGSRGESTA